jgi:hypothetical protein
MAASNDPVQLLAEVSRTDCFPNRFYAATHSQHIRVVIESREPFKPIGSSDCVVIEKRYDIGGHQAYSRITGSRKPHGPAALDQGHILHGGDETLIQVYIVVNHNNHLLRDERLSVHRFYDVKQ